MELEVIKALMSEFKAAELTKLSLKCEAFELILEKEKEVVQAVTQVAAAPAAITYAAPAAVSESIPAAAEKETAETAKHITSPMVGTFYASRTPGGKPFAEVGTKVKKGDVVCIIEAMKLMNEVEAEVDGEIVEVLVKNEQMVEYAQPLFVIK